MKGILEFTLPEEQPEFETAVNAGKYKSILWNLDQMLRHKIRHVEMTEAEDKLCQEIRNSIQELCQEESVSIE